MPIFIQKQNGISKVYFGLKCNLYNHKFILIGKKKRISKLIDTLNKYRNDNFSIKKQNWINDILITYPV